MNPEKMQLKGQLAESKKMSHIADHWLHFEREYDSYFIECRKNRFGPAGRRYKVVFTKYNQQMSEIGMEEQNA